MISCISGLDARYNFVTRARENRKFSLLVAFSFEIHIIICVLRVRTSTQRVLLKNRPQCV